MRIGHRHLERTTAAGAGWARSWAPLTLAIARTKHGDPEEALQLGRAALAYQVPMGDHARRSVVGRSRFRETAA